MILRKNDLWLSVLRFVGSRKHFKGLRIYDTMFSALNQILGVPVPLKIREFFDALQPEGLVLRSPYPTITLGIVCHPKDFAFLDLVVAHAIKHSSNPISEVVMVTTSEGVEALTRLFPAAKVVDENLFLNSEVIETLRNVVPNEIYGWVLQQVAKFTIVLTANNDATLILDADTLLLRDQVFLGSDGSQSISYSYEYHMPYAEHFSKYSGFSQDKTGHSYVTHYQLMQKDILKSFLPEFGLINWIKSANYEKFSPLADYHSYGEYIFRNYPHRIHVVRWGNISVKRQKIIKLLVPEKSMELYEKFSKWNSISIHSYL